MSTQLGEIAQPTFNDRINAFLHPLQPPVGVDPDNPPRTINGDDFDDAVMLLEALVDALRARVSTSDSGDETAGLADQIEGIVGNIIAAGGEVDREDQMAGEEWTRDVRYALARGTDPVYAGR